MNEKLISVIIPVYNLEKHIEKCVNSVRNQTYQNLEIILVDDGSNDISPDLCEAMASIDDRIKVVHKKNGGQSSARNAGLDICQGDYIGFVDGDDYIAPQMYRELFELAEKNPRMLPLTGMLDEDESHSYSILKHEKKNLSEIEYLRELLLFRGDTSVCSKLFSKSMIGNIRFDEGKLNEDILFMLKIIPAIDGIVFTEVNGYHYIKHSGSTTHSFGKAIHDMVHNSHDVHLFVKSHYPVLKGEAKAFEYRQNIAFLCAVPYYYNRGADPMCRTTAQYVRLHFLGIIFSRFLSARYKCMTVLIAINPKIISKLINVKNRKKYKGL